MKEPETGTNSRHTTTQLIGTIIGDVQEIIRSEVRLAWTEVKEEALKAAKAGAVLSLAAVLGLSALGFFLAMCATLLAMIMPLWIAFALVCVFCALIGGTLFFLGRSELRNVHKPEKTIRSIQENVQWVRNQTRSSST
jgi:apolipoprotein N-acyltransferase